MLELCLDAALYKKSDVKQSYWLGIFKMYLSDKEHCLRMPAPGSTLIVIMNTCCVFVGNM